MDLCLICGEEYDPMMEPDHEDNCQNEMAWEASVEVKADKTLKSLLESLLNEKKN